MDSINSLSQLEMYSLEPLPYWDFDKKIDYSPHDTMMKVGTLPYSSPYYSSSAMRTASRSSMADAALPNNFDECVGSDDILDDAIVAAKGGGDATPIVVHDRFDVVGGRGQGIQRLPGNKTYRELVSMNKVRRYCLQLNRRVDFSHVT
jgi:hypothetical protein